MGTSGHHNMNILLVEHGAEERALLKKQLLLLGHKVADCEDAETALELYQQVDFSLIIIALELAGMNGLEFCYKIQAFPQRAKTFILASTGHERPEEIQLALEAGANDYLLTPTSSARLQIRLLVVEQQLRELTEYYQTRRGQFQPSEQHDEEHSQDVTSAAGLLELSPNEITLEMDETAEDRGDFFTIKLEPTTLSHALEVCEKYFLHDMLVTNDWDKAKTAESLDIPLRILLRKMKKHNVFPREFLQKDSHSPL